MGYFLNKAKSMIQYVSMQTIPTRIDCEKSEISAKSSPLTDSPALTRNYRLKYPDAPATEQELSEIEDRVLTEGYMLLWSHVLEDFVSFYKTEADREKIPPGFVPYSDKELRELFVEGKATPSLSTLRLIHEAKKYYGGCVSSSSEEDET